MTGCSYETFFEEGGGELYSLKASVEDYGTNSRAGFDLNNGASFFWNSGDAIAVGSSVLTQFTTTASDGSTSAEFTGYGEPNGYAIYPWSGTQSISTNTLVYKYANTYTYESVDTDFFNGMSVEIPMWGKIVDNAVMFKHLGGVVAFKFPNLKAGANQVFTMIADRKISGEFSADLTSETPKFETTTTDVQDSDKQVTINFSMDSDADAVFYVPVPTGVYEFTIKIQNGEEVFTCAYKNLAVERRDIRYTTISAHSLQGSEAVEVESPEEITDALQNSNSVVVESIVSATPESEVSIEIPKKESGADEIHTISITAIDDNTETINISEVASGAGNSIEELVIHVPSTEDAKKLNVDMPNTSVTIVANGVEVLTLGEVTAITADNTLIVENNVVINKLIVVGGNVRIKEGAKVLEIVNSDDNKNVTYVIYEGAIPASAVDTEYVKHIDAAYYDMLQACQASGAQEIVLNKNISLASALTIANNTNLTIDLNGYAISYESDIMAHSSMINVSKGSSLTVKDSGNGGKISYTYTGEGNSQFGWGTYTIVNSGDLVVEDGTIEMLCDLNTPGNVIHMYSAIQQSGATGTTTINGGTISTPTYRSIRINGGSLAMNGGVMDGQVWLQPNQGNVTITVTGGEYSPSPVDGSSIFMRNQGENYTVSSAKITGGTFATKIGSTNPTLEGVAGCVTGGVFTESAKNNTNANLIAPGAVFKKNGDGSYTLFVEFEQVSENVYEIKSKAGFEYFRDLVNNGNSFAGCTIKLVADIDLENSEWTPIGSIEQEHGFCGNFEGNNKTIKNLKITAITPDADGYVYAGLFGITEENTIKDFTIENVNISLNGHIVSAAIAYPYYTTVENITVKGDIKIKGGDYTAGILSYTRRCVNAKDLTISGNSGSTITGAHTVGGVISDIQMNGGLIANYSNFSASGLTITAGDMHVGGISGIISGQTLDGATVENVTIVCDDARKGIVSGSLGETSTIKNVSYSNVSGVENIIGATYSEGYMIVVDGDVYSQTKSMEVVSSEEELNAALANEEITSIVLSGNIAITNTLYITRSITIDGNGNAISYKGAAGGRIIDVKKEYPNVDFTLLNISLLNSTNSYIERGVNYNTNGKLTLDNVTIGSENGQVITYAINMPTSAKDAVVDIKNSSITGNIALNVWSQNNEITIENSDLYTYDTSDVEGYAVVKLNNDGINTAEGSIINIIGGSVKVTYKNPEDVNISYSIDNKTFTGEIIVSGTTEVVGDIKYAAVIVAYKNTDNSYDFPSLQAAINKAAESPQSVDEIRLIRDIQLNEPVTIPAGLSVLLNLNGKSITQTSDAPVSMIINDGNLTIKDSGNTGKIAFTFNGTPNNDKSANVVANKGVLIVNGGEILNSGSGNQIGYAIDNYNGASLTINGGKVAASGSSYYDGIRLFCGSKETVVTVNNGEVSSIWAQNPSNNKAAEVSGTVIINGGTVSATYYENYTTVKVATGVTASVSPYGAGSDNTTSTVVDGYTVYSFVH